MDKGTGPGILTAFGLIAGSILLGGSLLDFIDTPSVLLVVGCLTATLFVALPVEQVIGGVKAAKAAFFVVKFDSKGTVELLAELSNRARRDGLLSLEEAAEDTDNEFLARGLRMMADGHDPTAIESVLYDEIGKIEQRHGKNIGLWDGVTNYAPAMGLIGTLVGLVQMLKNLNDPSAIGPAMAVALLTTFYGAILANIVGMPIAGKLKARSEAEIAFKELIAQGLVSILGGENPRFMIERLNATLPPESRYEEAA